MPRFEVITDADGCIKEIIKDGVSQSASFNIMQVQSISRFYFSSAKKNLLELELSIKHEDKLRYGTQSILFSIIGTEAFSAAFFKVQFRYKNDQLELLNPDKVSEKISDRIAVLVERHYGRKFDHQDQILERLQLYYGLRNRIVHPKWKPASVSIGAMQIEGLTETFLNHLADPELASQVYDYCLLAIARIGALGNSDDGTATLFHWAGEDGLTGMQLAKRLGLQ